MASHAHHLIRIRPRPDTLYASRGRCVLATDRQGFISGGMGHGLFVHETRLLSRYVLLVNGRAVEPNALSNVEQHSWLGYYLLPVPNVDSEMDGGSGAITQASQQSLEIRVSRVVGDGLHEDVDLTNFSQHPARFDFEMELDADFADLIETVGERKQHGECRRTWRMTSDKAYELEFEYAATHVYQQQNESGTAEITRSAVLRFENATTPATDRGDRIRFEVELPPGGEWHVCLRVLAWIDATRFEPTSACRALSSASTFERKSRFLAESTKFRADGTDTLAPVVIGALEQSAYDLDALRLDDLDHGPRAWTMAAGLPMYVALFGRDVLTAAWQAAMAGPEPMRGSLQELERWQGTEINQWRDEQPGRMLHEAHTGPLEILNFNPRARSYSSVTTSAFFPTVLAELWHWTGDRDLVRRLVPAALRSIQWLDDYCLSDGHGFYQYQTESKDGVRNQAWKDSGDAIVYDDGSQVEPPIATCEEQGVCVRGKDVVG